MAAPQNLTTGRTDQVTSFDRLMGWVLLAAIVPGYVSVSVPNLVVGWGGRSSLLAMPIVMGHVENSHVSCDGLLARKAPDCATKITISRLLPHQPGTEFPFEVDGSRCRGYEISDNQRRIIEPESTIPLILSPSSGRYEWVKCIQQEVGAARRTAVLSLVGFPVLALIFGAMWFAKKEEIRQAREAK